MKRIKLLSVATLLFSTAAVPALADWNYIGEESFAGFRDHKLVNSGSPGVGATLIGLEPMNTDARCYSMTVTFGNGEKSDLNLETGGTVWLSYGAYLQQGLVTTVELPGFGEREIRRVAMHCMPVTGRQVTIQVFGNA